MKYCTIIFCILLAHQGASQSLDATVANKLSQLPLHCIDQEYPNKTSHSAEGPEDAILTPSQLHPSFYGCFDWHSSVHGHWMLIKLLKEFPELSNRKEIIEKLDQSFLPENIKKESEYFHKYKLGKIYERTYGWAWLLKLDEELMNWNDPLAKKWHQNLQPLTQTIVALWKEYLPKQTYPNRTGVHPNSAFALGFAIDWARKINDEEFEKQLIQKSLQFYANDSATPAYLEPDGTDFFSPSLSIADLMTRIYERKDFEKWLIRFYEKRSINNIMKQPEISDHTDYQITHLNGLLFSRAWCMKRIAGHLPENSEWRNLFLSQSEKFIYTGLENLEKANYGGDHWLASFAVYSLLD